MASKASTASSKSKTSNGVRKPEISMTYIDDILLRLDKAEDDIDWVLKSIDSLDNKVNKVASRLGLD